MRTRIETLHPDPPGQKCEKSERMIHEDKERNDRRRERRPSRPQGATTAPAREWAAFLILGQGTDPEEGVRDAAGRRSCVVGLPEVRAGFERPAQEATGIGSSEPDAVARLGLPGDRTVAAPKRFSSDELNLFGGVLQESRAVVASNRPTLALPGPHGLP
jgi:hypothetical protein